MRHFTRGQHQQPQVARCDPLYLFCCSLSWLKQADASAGWELTRGLRSQDRETRTLASVLLAKTAGARLPIRDLRRARRGQNGAAIGNFRKPLLTGPKRR